MKPWIAGLCSVIVAFVPASTFAQEDPAAVYAHIHRATLAGKADEAISHATAASKAEMAKTPKAERDAIMQVMARMMPKTYAITGTAISPDGNSAVLQGSGPGGILGTAPMYLTANFLKQGGAWKVDNWGWSNDKPAPLAKAQVAPAAQPGAAPSRPEPMAKATPARVETPQQNRAQAMPATPMRRSRSHEDARECLGRGDSIAITKCAEKFL